MNLSLTIPQLFYDVIARVLPGFLFLFVLQFGVKGTEFELALAEEIGKGNSVSSLFIGLTPIFFLVIHQFRETHLETLLRQRRETVHADC